MTESHVVVFGSTALEPDALLVRRMDGVEEISRLFEYELLLQTATPEDLADDELEGLLAKPSYIAFGPHREHRVWGTIRSIEMQSVATATEAVLYRAFLVPRVWTLSLTKRSRVHLDKRVPQIVKAVFESNGMADLKEFQTALTGHASEPDATGITHTGVEGYPVRGYTAQYNETDLAFVSRLLEHEGISFYFAHDDEDGDRLVMVDANASFPELADPTVPYLNPGTVTGTTEAITSLKRCEQMVPKRVTLHEHDFRQPRQIIEGTQEVVASGRGEHVVFGEHFPSVPEGRRLARIRADELRAGRVVFRARSTIAGLHAGHRLTLTGHPMPELDQLELLVTRVEHHVTQPEAGAGDGQPYHNELVAIPYATAFRPARVTPKPKIHGVMTATIWGAQAGTTASIDDGGSYFAQMGFDGEPPSAAATPSARIRMLQAFAGNAHGIHFPLHIGTEVMIAHLDGDPDRPVIVGAVPNPETRSPVTSTNASQSVVQTRAGIQVHFEDDAGGP